MKRKIVKKILSVVLAASMIFGNVGLPQELKEVHAVQTDIGSIISCLLYTSPSPRDCS